MLLCNGLIVVVPAVLAILCTKTDAKQSDLIIQFTANFRNRTLSDAKTKRIFTTYRLTAQEASDEYYNNIYQVSKSTDEIGAKLDATVVSRAVKSRWDTWRRHQMIKTFGDSAADVLLVLGRLNSTNVLKLSNDYAQGMKQAIEGYYKKNVPKTKVLSLVSGYGGYFAKLGLFTKEFLPAFGILFANNVYNN